MLKIGVLISGGGTNLQAIIDNTLNGRIDGEVALIISNKEDAYGLVRGEKAGIKSIFIDPKAYGTSEAYDEKLIEEFEKMDVDLIVLAGYLKILSVKFVGTFLYRIINVHPSLIPSFCGKGYYGDYVHQCVLDSGVRYTGATVHFVEDEADAGPIILQEVVKIDQDDTINSLKAKVLEVEHEILVEALALYSNGNIELDGRKVILHGGSTHESAY